MNVIAINSIVNPEEILANKGEVFTVTNKYTSFGNVWYDLANDRIALNIRCDVFDTDFAIID